MIIYIHVDEYGKLDIFKENKKHVKECLEAQKNKDTTLLRVDFDNRIISHCFYNSTEEHYVEFMR